MDRYSALFSHRQIFLRMARFRKTTIPENIGSRRYAKEGTLAAYLMGEFTASDERIRGNIGVRVIRADVDARAMVLDSTGATPQYIQFAGSSSYKDVLPSLISCW